MTERYWPDWTFTDGGLVVAGIPVSRLQRRVGATPFFAYDRQRITDRVAHVRAALPPGLRLHYAVKANPMPAVVQHLSRLVDGLDVASAGEMRVALDTGEHPGRVTFAGPGKSDVELEQAVAAGVLVEVESVGEGRRLGIAAATVGVVPRVAIRVNPDFALRGAGMRMGGGPQQFGIDAEEVPGVVAGLTGSGLDVVGFHVFAGSQNLSAELISQAQRQTVDLVLRLADEARIDLRYLNLGGGFGIPYFPADAPLELDVVGATLHELVTGPLSAHADHAELVVELGRYLVGESGVYVTRVVDRKMSRGRTFLVVDGGLHHQLAASGNFGQAIRRNYPVKVAWRAAGGTASAEPEPVTVVGCLCTPLDLLADQVELPAAQVGDLVAIFQAGAYGLSASPMEFLSHPRPAEVLVTPSSTEEEEIR